MVKLSAEMRMAEAQLTASKQQPIEGDRFVEVMESFVSEAAQVSLQAPFTIIRTLPSSNRLPNSLLSSKQFSLRLHPFPVFSLLILPSLLFSLCLLARLMLLSVLVVHG